MDPHQWVSSWSALLLTFSTCFTAGVDVTWVRYLTGWVLATGRRTVTGVLPFADPKGARSHDSYHYLLRRARWPTDSLWRTWVSWLVTHVAQEGRLALDLDDTLFHKSGRKVDGTGWWRDAVRSTGTRTVHALGLNLVVLTLRVEPSWAGEPLGLPINLRLHRKGGPTLLDLAAEMVGEVARWLPKRSFSLCADGAYAALAGRDLPRTTVTSRMRRDAALYALPARRRPGQRGRTPQKGPRLPAPRDTAPHLRRWTRIQVNERGRLVERLVATQVVLWYAVCGRQALRLVFSRDPQGRQPDDFFFTTDLSLPPEAILAAVAGRWSIEDTFRNVKQYLGGEEPQTWRGQGPERAAMLSFLLYGLVWACYLRAGGPQAPLERPAWYPHKAHPSFQDALRMLRRALWTERISAASRPTPIPQEILSLLTHALSASA
jgi:hypothetical protein